MSLTNGPIVTHVLFDFGGVIADEGFKAGIRHIAESAGLDPDKTLLAAFESVYGIGFTSGNATETEFWKVFREQTGVGLTDEDLTEIILSRFVPRPWMLEVAESLRLKGLRTAILSDQTHWLDELNRRYGGFFHCFDQVFNSYHLRMTKKDPLLFDRILQVMDAKAEQTLFIDDHPANINRARSRGLQTHLYTAPEPFLQQMETQFGLGKINC